MATLCKCGNIILMFTTAMERNARFNHRYVSTLKNKTFLLKDREESMAKISQTNIAQKLL